MSIQVYNKIPALYKRDSDNPRNVLEGVFKDKYVELLHEWPIWTVTEKLDGANVRIIWDGVSVTVAGRRAEYTQPNIEQAVREQYPMLEELFEQTFDTDPDDPDDNVVVYGEGFGPGVQKGGKYGDRIQFRVFDVTVGPYMLEFDPNGVWDVAGKLGLLTVPIVEHGSTVPEVLDMMQYYDGLNSMYGDFLPEGYVLRPVPALYRKDGSRVMVKLTYRDIAQFT